MTSNIFSPLHDTIAAIMAKQHFFIMGTPKSGTTWIQQMLDAHPLIHCSGEGHFVKGLYTNLENMLSHYNDNFLQTVIKDVYQGNGYYTPLTRSDLNYAASILCCLLFAKRPIADNVQCIGDKTPIYTTQIQSLKHMFPNAKFIHIIRDGRDVLISWIKHNARMRGRDIPTQGSELYIKEMEDAVNRWKTQIQTARQTAKAFPDDYLEIRYEACKSDPKATLHAMLSFLNLPLDPADIKHCIDTTDFAKLSGGRKAGEESNTSFYRKGIVGDWKQTFNQQTEQRFMELAGDMLKELDYV